MSLFDLAMAARPLELALMAAVFVGIVWRALSPGRRQVHQDNAMIPLRGDGE